MGGGRGSEVGGGGGEGGGGRQADMDRVFFIKKNLLVLVTCYL